MMKNPSYCYKFYWLEAIVHLIAEDVKETNFNEMIDEMIANAWYTVLEFHIHLSGMIEGQVKDGLERAILKLQKLSQLPGNASKVEIKNNIKKYDKELRPYKDQLTNMVPYRALAGFFCKCQERALEYIQNGEKTEEKILVGSINCLPETAYEQMFETKQIFGKRDKRKGYHIIISFPPDEATPDQAFEVTRRFAEEHLGENYEVVYSVHTDKAHNHGHIVWNSVSFVDGTKYDSLKGNWIYHLHPRRDSKGRKLWNGESQRKMENMNINI